MRISPQVGVLREVGPGDPPPADPGEDVRGREVRDNAGAAVGRVAGLLMDDREHRVRLLRVEPALGAPSRLIPVDAVGRIGDREVTLTRALAHVAAAPPPRAAMTQPYLESVYAHYGLYPYWSPGYVYPSYPAY